MKLKVKFLKIFAVDYSESIITINGNKYIIILNKNFSAPIIDCKTNKLIDSIEVPEVNKSINGK